MSEQLELRLLGGMHLTRNGAPVTDHSSKKGLALLSYLAISGRAHSRDELAGVLWGDMPDTEARANLRGVLFNLRRLVAPYLHVDRQMVAFDRQSPYWVDVAHFQSGILQIESVKPENRIESLREAVELYCGDLMEGFYVRGAPAFEEWLLVEREQLRQLAIQGFYMLAVHYTTQGEYAAAIRYTTRLLEMDPWREEAYRQQMLLLALSGQRCAALAQYETCRRILEYELKVEPAEETTTLYQRIRGGMLNTSKQAGAGVHPATTHARGELRLGDLPFLGRGAEYAWLFYQWEAARCSNGVFTLVHGDAGVGKTRLVEELLRYAVGVGALLQGRCHRFEHEVPYQPIVEILRGLLQNMPSVFQALPKHCLLELTLLLPELRASYPDLPATPTVSDEAARQRLFESVAQLCLALVGDQPSVVLFLDDLHQADPPTVDLLRYLLYRLHDTPLWCVGAYRSEEVDPDNSMLLLIHDLGQIQCAALLQFHPLEAQVSAQLVDRLPGLSGQAQQLAAYLRDEAEGNAFFLAQLLHDLEQRGILSAKGDEWCVDRQRLANEQGDVPESVCAMILGPVSRLPPSVRAVLDMAAVIGRTFDLRLLIRAFDQSIQDVDECIEILLARHLVRETRPAASLH
jgi:DNA-binding SARP family transcriptional activator